MSEQGNEERPGTPANVFPPDEDATKEADPRPKPPSEEPSDSGGQEEARDREPLSSPEQPDGPQTEG